MISRVKQNNYINLLDIETDYSIMGIVESLCKDVEQYYDIIISKGEKIYIYLHFVANTHMEAADIDDEWLERSVQNILDIIYENYSFDLRDDEILTGDLFRHMKSIFINKSFGLNIRNPLINTIKNNYPLAFKSFKAAIPFSLSFCFKFCNGVLCCNISVGDCSYASHIAQNVFITSSHSDSSIHCYSRCVATGNCQSY